MAVGIGCWGAVWKFKFIFSVVVVFDPLLIEARYLWFFCFDFMLFSDVL